jgi:hypothetical protein
MYLADSCLSCLILLCRCLESTLLPFKPLTESLSMTVVPRCPAHSSATAVALRRLKMVIGQPLKGRYQTFVSVSHANDQKETLISARGVPIPHESGTAFVFSSPTPQVLYLLYCLATCALKALASTEIDSRPSGLSVRPGASRQ